MGIIFWQVFIKQSNQKWAEHLNRHGSKENIEDQKHMKRYSMSLITREMKIKTTIMVASHQWEWPSSKIVQAVNAREGVEKSERSYAVDGNVNWYNHSREYHAVSLQN